MSLGYAPQLKANQLDQVTARAGNAAKLTIYGVGTRPPTSGGALGSAVALAVVIMSTPFAPSAVQGTGGPLLPGLPPAVTVTGASNVALWARLTQTDGTTFVMDLSVSTIAAGTGDLQISDTNLVNGGTLTLTAASIASGN